jgi:predicted N-acetyltransferase YhbS
MGKIVPLLSASSLDFDCGDDQLNRWFKVTAIQSEAAGFSRNYVMLDKANIVGFYSLSAAAVDIEPSEFAVPGSPKPTPAVLLGRVAVATDYQGNGVGKRLMFDAIQRSKLIAKRVGASVLLVHPRPDVKDYFVKNGFLALTDSDAVFLKL